MATGAGLVILAWLGITSFWQIPKAVDQSSTGQVASEAEKARNRAVKAADEISKIAAAPLNRPEQGFINPLKEGKLSTPNGHKVWSGTITFKSPYTDFVVVHCGLRQADITGKARFVITTKPKEDHTGFDWKFEIWSDTNYAQCQLDWLAIGK